MCRSLLACALLALFFLPLSGCSNGEGDSDDPGTPVVPDDDDSASDDDDSAGADDDDSAAPPAADSDGDGTPGDQDCNDDDAEIHPGATEVCDGVDNNCDGVTDQEDAADAPTWFEDVDGDGYGIDTSTQVACTQPHGFSAYSGDCNDADPSYHPGAAEADCTDPADYNCDGSVGYADVDTDGEPACEDCDDNDIAINSAATEACNGSDDDCDGQIDEEGATGESSWYLDADGDGYGRLSWPSVACDQPTGFVANSDDCDDLDASSYPGGPEVCDGADNNCDQVIDEGVTNTYYDDVDGDGYGDPSALVTGCFLPGGASANDQDCDDGEPSVHPGGVELCDGLDNDCDNNTDNGALDATTWYADSDGDGFGAPFTGTTSCSPVSGAVSNSLDCDDSSTGFGINPSAQEICDAASTDEDCDGLADDDDLEGADGRTTWYPDLDNDTYGDETDTGTLFCVPPVGLVMDNTDCDDSTTSTHPGGAEICDPADVDEDCSGTADDIDPGVTDQTTWYVDSDDDTYGANSDPGTTQCDAPTGTVAVQGDCNDGDDAVFPDSSGLCAAGPSCQALLSSGLGVVSGVYTVDSDGPTGSEPPYDVYCDQAMESGGWTLLLTANGPSTYWGNNSPNWSLPGTDTPPTGGPQDDDYHAAAYGTHVSDEIRLCYQDTGRCYTFTHSQSRTLQSFFTSGESFVDYSQGSSGYSDAGSSSSRDSYLSSLGVSAQSVNCYWLGINDTRSISSIGLVGDWNSGCNSSGHHDDLAIGVGLQSCHDQNSCSNGGSGHAAGRTRGFNGVDNSGVQGPWFVFGR